MTESEILQYDMNSMKEKSGVPQATYWGNPTLGFQGGFLDMVRFELRPEEQVNREKCTYTL